MKKKIINYEKEYIYTSFCNGKVGENVGELIKKYFRLKLEYKESSKKELREINRCVKQLYEITADLKLLIDEYKDESYKVKFQKEHKKRVDQEKEAREIIDELMNTIKDLQRKDN